MKKTDSGLPQLAAQLASKGRGGDTMLAHINPQEAALLKALGGSGTINPETGLPEYWGLNDLTGGLYDATVGQVVGPHSITGSLVENARENITGPAAEFVGDVAQKVGQTADAIMSDPKKLGAVAVMIAFPGAAQYIGESLLSALPAEAAATLGTTGTKIIGQAAINTALNGGDVSSGIKSALVTQGAPVAAQELAKYITPENATAIDKAFAKYGSQMATQAGAAALMGKDPAAALLFAGANAATDLVLNQAIKNMDPDMAKAYKSLPLPAQNAVATTIAAKLTGTDLSSALANTFVSEAIGAARNVMNVQQKVADVNKVGLNEDQLKSLNPQIFNADAKAADLAANNFASMVAASQNEKFALSDKSINHASIPMYGYYDYETDTYKYDEDHAKAYANYLINEAKQDAEFQASVKGFKSAADQYDANQAGYEKSSDWYKRPAGIQVASSDLMIPKVGFTGSPIYAESPDAKSVSAPFGYELMPASMADKRPEGSYYDETQNAWLMPNSSVLDLQAKLQQGSGQGAFDFGNVQTNADGSRTITGDDGSTITFGPSGDIIGHTSATDASSVANLGNVEVTAPRPTSDTVVANLGNVEVTAPRPTSDTVTDLGSVEVTDTRPETTTTPPTNPPVTPPVTPPTTPPVTPPTTPPVNPPVTPPVIPAAAAAVLAGLIADNKSETSAPTPQSYDKWTWNWNQQPVQPVENGIAMGQEFFRPTYTKAAEGGLMSLSGGGTSSSLGAYSDGGRLLRGPGDGMSDSIPATIGNKQPARLGDGEFVVPADVVSHLGNGSTDAGAKVLYSMMDRVRQARTGSAKQGKQINPKKFMPK